MAQVPGVRFSRDLGENVGVDNDPHPATPQGQLVTRTSVVSTYVGDEVYTPITLAGGASLASGGASLSYTLLSASYATASGLSFFQDAFIYTDTGKFDVYLSDNGTTYTYRFTVIPGVSFRVNIANKKAIQIRNPYGANCNAFIVAVQ